MVSDNSPEQSKTGGNKINRGKLSLIVALLIVLVCAAVSYYLLPQVDFDRTKQIELLPYNAHVELPKLVSKVTRWKQESCWPGTNLVWSDDGLHLMAMDGHELNHIPGVRSLEWQTVLGVERVVVELDGSESYLCCFTIAKDTAANLQAQQLWKRSGKVEAWSIAENGNTWIITNEQGQLSASELDESGSVVAERNLSKLLAVKGNSVDTFVAVDCASEPFGGRGLAISFSDGKFYWCNQKLTQVNWSFDPREQLGGSQASSYSVLDNGRLLFAKLGNSGSGSAIVESQVTVDKNQARIAEVASFTGEPGRLFFLARGGSAQRLPNGNTLVTAVNQRHLFELNGLGAEGEVVWEWTGITPCTRLKSMRLGADSLVLQWLLQKNANRAWT